MPAQVNNLPALPVVPFQLSGQPGTNANGAQRQQNANQPWSVRIEQVNNPISIPFNTVTQMGFDTLSYNTYKPAAQPIYSLRFASISSGGNSFPYSTITVPNYGLYDIRFNWIISVTGSGIAIQTFCLFYVNGTNVTQKITSQVPSGNGFTGDQVTDILLLNPKDVLTFSVVQIDTTSASLPTANGASNIFATIRYLGLS